MGGGESSEAAGTSLLGLIVTFICSLVARKLVDLSLKNFNMDSKLYTVGPIQSVTILVWIAKHVQPNKKARSRV